MIYKYINTPFTYVTYKRLGYTSKKITFVELTVIQKLLRIYM